VAGGGPLGEADDVVQVPGQGGDLVLLLLEPDLVVLGQGLKTSTERVPRTLQWG
jgi:hypothetical protein